VAGLEGTNVGPYEIKALLGAGGMGQVYRAHDPRLEREVAIKVLSAGLAHEPGYLERFRREARAVARLNHPNVVQVYDFGEQGDLTYLVMPLLSGGTLRDYLNHRKILPLAEAVSIAEQVASALQYAHERGLIHRDVKPANILLNTGNQALLSDFGIVRLVHKEDNAQTLTHMGAFVGSPEYAAPEMVTGQQIDQRVDIYALGVMLFQMLTGRLPFSAATMVSVLMMQAQQPPPPPRSINPDIPPAVEAVILKALAKKPEDRYQTAAEFLAALRAAVVTPAAGTISDLPTAISSGPAPVPGSGPAAVPPSGPGSVTPSIWVGPGSGPAAAPQTPVGGWPAPGSGPAAAPQVPPSGWTAPGNDPTAIGQPTGAGWPAPGSGPAGWGAPGSGPSGWANPASGPAATPPLPQTYITGVSVAPFQAPGAPSPARPPQRRWLVLGIVLALVVVIVVGGTLGALAVFSKNKTGNTPPQATSTTTGTSVPTATPAPTLTPTPPVPAGKTTEFGGLTNDSKPWSITKGPDGNLWFTESNTNQIGRITPQGTDLKEFQTPTGDSEPINITTGPDGNLWFTEYNGNKIGRITPQGDIEEFNLPTANSQPWGITKGPDGNLWFTERAGRKIGRISPQGTDLQEYPVTSAITDPLEIITGPDGNLWFTDYKGNHVGHISPQGTNLQAYPVPTFDSRPWGITIGPDGNIWFAEYNKVKIGRITLQGDIQEYPIPTAKGHPVGIVKAPDGNLWFTEQLANKVGRITPQGDVTEFTLPGNNTYPQGITVGPDNYLWIAQNQGNQIGRVSTGK
jgi:streptogramin lyase